MTIVPQVPIVILQVHMIQVAVHRVILDHLADRVVENNIPDRLSG